MTELAETTLTQAEIDQFRLFELIRSERFARDSGDWDGLTEHYLPESYVRTTWFRGTGAEFSAMSKDMAEKGRHSKHPIWPIYAKVNGDRAITESYAQIQNRSTIEGIEVDMTQHCRFFSQAVRTPQGWKFLSFEAIYQKDSIQPVVPGTPIPLKWEDVEHLRPSYRIWAWAMTLRGYDVPDDLLGDDRPDLMAEFYARMNAWLNESPTYEL